MSYTAKEFRRKYKISLRRYRAMCRFRQQVEKAHRRAFGQKNKGVNYGEWEEEW